MNAVALIIDDNHRNLDALALLLKREGVQPITLLSPRDISAVLGESGPVDVVFLDLEFPHHDGLALVRQLQADPRLTGVPIVAYTVHVSEQNEARDAGFHSFIGKPLSVERFPDQLRRILDGERVWEVD
ncbi:MAG: response regulator [Anaerolineae bacterium]|nr:response regulator [Anaerolineae bacterium]